MACLLEKPDSLKSGLAPHGDPVQKLANIIALDGIIGSLRAGIY